MLRSVCLKNFVKFKNHQRMDFSSGGPFILIGENGSGKSSVLEGIRRCLKLDLSTSVSSVYNSKEISYFICNVEAVISKKEKNVIFGIVSIPGETEQSTDMQSGNTKEMMDAKHTSDELETDGNHIGHRKVSVDEGKKGPIGNGNESKHQSSRCRYYKFALMDNTILINLIFKSTTPKGKADLTVSESYMLCGADQFNETMSKQKPDENEMETSIKLIFGNLHNGTNTSKEQLEELLDLVTEEFVFTLPLRSIGPLQWSKSDRISKDLREKNYAEAEHRCEIIKYFLKNGEEFDKDKEQKYFRQLLLKESDDYNFKLDSDDKIHLSEGKFALLKTPEGILEAKAFSILISSKKFKTILLEEPDRGMHPQLMQRMIQIMKEEKNNKRVILTTHQKGFVTPWTVPDIFVFRCSGKENQIISCKSILGEEKNIKKMRLLTSQHVPDILFAKKALFFEGDSEQLFLEELKSQVLAGETASNQLKECLMEYTLIKMNSKDNREFYTKVADNLKLHYLVVVDRDAVPGIQGKNKTKDMRIRERDAAKSRSQDEWKDLRKYLMKAENIFFWLDGSIEDMVEAMCDGNSDLKESLIKQKVINKKGKIYGKKQFFLDNCIGIGNIIESVKSILAYCNQEHDLAEFFNILANKNY